MLALGGNNLPSPQGWSPAQTWAMQLEEGTPDEMLVLCYSTRRVQDFGAAREWGAGLWHHSWVAQTLTRVCSELKGVFLCSFCEAFAVCSTEELWAHGARGLMSLCRNAPQLRSSPRVGDTPSHPSRALVSWGVLRPVMTLCSVLSRMLECTSTLKNVWDSKAQVLRND